MKYLKAINLFLSLVFREVEPKSCGIPDPYRCKGRITIKSAWDIAYFIHLRKVKP